MCIPSMSLTCSLSFWVHFLKKFYASDETLIKDLYRPDPIVVNAMVPAEEVASIMEKYELVVIPVVNDFGVLIGRITIDDALGNKRSRERLPNGKRYF